jgi:hypothetical protein
MQQSILEHTNDIKFEKIFDMLYKTKFESNVLGVLTEKVGLKLVRSCMKFSFDKMLNDFLLDCIQNNPHVSYLKVPQLLQNSIGILKKNLEKFVDFQAISEHELMDFLDCIATFLKCVKKLRKNCLNFIEAKLILKFIHENLLDNEFSGNLLNFVNKILENFRISSVKNLSDLQRIFTTIWMILSEYSCVRTDLVESLDLRSLFKLLHGYLKVQLFNTRFFQNYEDPMFIQEMEDEEVSWNFSKVVFFAKFLVNLEDLKVFSLDKSFSKIKVSFGSCFP